LCGVIKEKGGYIRNEVEEKTDVRDSRWWIVGIKTKRRLSGTLIDVICSKPIVPPADHCGATVVFGALRLKDIRNDLQCYYPKHDGTKRHARDTLVTCSTE
jgi:hypothetical protein